PLSHSTKSFHLEVLSSRCPLLSPVSLKLLLKVELLLEQVVAYLCRVTKIHVRLRVGIIRSPLGQAFAIWIAGPGKINPVIRDHAGQFSIRLAPGHAGPLLQVVADVNDL